MAAALPQGAPDLHLQSAFVSTSPHAHGSTPPPADLPRGAHVSVAAIECPSGSIPSAPSPQPATLVPGDRRWQAHNRRTPPLMTSMSPSEHEVGDSSKQAASTSVAAESAFSTSERIINDHRTRLAGNTVEALLCFQDWLRSAGPRYLDIISITTTDSNNDDHQ